jgi:plasmid stability protein
MAQIILRNISQALKARLQRQARRNGHSLQNEIREILQKALPPETKKNTSELGLGSEIATLVAKRGGFNFDIPELHATMKLKLPPRRNKRTKLPIIGTQRPDRLRLTNKQMNELLFP